MVSTSVQAAVSGKNRPLSHILRYLPARFADTVREYVRSNPAHEDWISELRFRAGGLFSVTVAGQNVCRFPERFVYCSAEDVAQTLSLLCEDSVHTYGETMKEGYLFLDGGYRVGLCGHARCDDDRLKSVYGITSLSIRIPHGVFGIAGPVLPLICEDGAIRPTLFYAPPGIGKTTLLRDVAASLRERRIALIDTRGELYQEEAMNCTLIDVLYGYPRAKGIEIATRTLAAEAVICDEIGTAEESAAILTAQNSGVPLIASAHAENETMLFERPNIRLLRDAGIFRYYIGLRRKGWEKRFSFHVFDAWQNRSFDLSSEEPS
ncbi:MAG: hypothetical protein KBS76_02555 [Ruminococcus sp.]|nr:hypothetical protein [Candidatus Apopatosoma intestinale]